MDSVGKMCTYSRTVSTHNIPLGGFGRHTENGIPKVRKNEWDFDNYLILLNGN